LRQIETIEVDSANRASPTDGRNLDLHSVFKEMLESESDVADVALQRQRAPAHGMTQAPALKCYTFNQYGPKTAEMRSIAIPFSHAKQD
jgi:hypothetical protein